MKNSLLVSIAAVALAACQPAGDDGAANTAAPATGNAAETETLPPDESTMAMNEATGAAEPVGAAGIPAALVGRWGMVPADCEPGRDDAKGLMTVSADRLEFYESRGTLGTVAERSATRLVADFAFTGEGQEWTRRMALDVQDGGAVLIRREQGADAMPGPQRYEKCAA